jgi:hypothetical protein
MEPNPDCIAKQFAYGDIERYSNSDREPDRLTKQFAE